MGRTMTESSKETLLEVEVLLDEMEEDLERSEELVEASSEHAVSFGS